jgi:UDP-N-acetyl-D-mannosaminuronate dehydrogenase
MAAEPAESISVIGRGKLGACMAAAPASRFKVIGYDLDQRKINHLKNGLAPAEEPRLQETTELADSRLTANLLGRCVPKVRRSNPRMSRY